MGAYIEILKSDARTHKATVITEAIQFTQEESSAFGQFIKNMSLS